MFSFIVFHYSHKTKIGTTFEILKNQHVKK